jgi:hypothetical protein
MQLKNMSFIGLLKGNFQKTPTFSDTKKNEPFFSMIPWIANLPVANVIKFYIAHIIALFLVHIYV